MARKKERGREREREREGNRCCRQSQMGPSGLYIYISLVISFIRYIERMKDRLDDCVDGW